LTDNVATELGLSSGTKGIFCQIIYEEWNTTLAHTDTKFPQGKTFILIMCPEIRVADKLFHDQRWYWIDWN
jgi:hypothetical protein